MVNASWHALERRALSNDGVFNLREARQEGVSLRQLERRTENGLLTYLHPSVYKIASYPETHRSRMRAAQRWVENVGWLSHRSAGELLEIDGCPKGCTEVSAYGGGRRSGRGVIVHRLLNSDRPKLQQRRDGFLISSPDRTLLDLCAVLPYRLADRAAEDLLRRQLISIDSMISTVMMYGGRGRNGSRNFRRIVDRKDDRDGAVRNKFESKMLRILKETGEPFVPDHDIPYAGGFHTVDFALTPLRLGIECHSMRWHRGEEKWRKDITRHRRLASLGWEILYFTWWEVIEEPQMVRAEIQKALKSSSRTTETVVSEEDLGA